MDRAWFDELLEDELAALPEELAAVLVDVPLLVDAEPSAAVRRDLGMAPDEDLLGLHWGIPLGDPEGVRDAPDRLMVFAGPIWRLADDLAGDDDEVFAEELARQIHITLWHEIGHALGMDEDDLERLGYG